MPEPCEAQSWPDRRPLGAAGLRAVAFGPEEVYLCNQRLWDTVGSESRASLEVGCNEGKGTWKPSLEPLLRVYPRSLVADVGAHPSPPGEIPRTLDGVLK